MKIDDEEKEARKFLAYILTAGINSKGISQVELSKLVDIKKSALNDIFNAKTTPSLVRTLKLFEVLDIKMESFLNKWNLLNNK